MMPPNNIFTSGAMSADVRGLAEAQAELQRLAMATSAQPDGGLRTNILLGLLQLQRYALGIVHVDTGRLKNSIFTDDETRGNNVIGYVATNVEYAPAEHARGGSHAFFQRTVGEEGPNVANDLFRGITVGGRQ